MNLKFGLNLEGTVMVRSQILKARKYRRSDLLNKEKREVNQNKLFLNITYHPSLSL